ncbi:MAG: hypothetical protein R3D67_06935 [Hyphomicrobiaceae bacterium]
MGGNLAVDVSGAWPSACFRLHRSLPMDAGLSSLVLTESLIKAEKAYTWAAPLGCRLGSTFMPSPAGRDHLAGQSGRPGDGFGSQAQDVGVGAAQQERSNLVA